MNAAAGLVTGLLIAAGIWTLLTGGTGEAMSRRLCGEGLASVPCVLAGVVLAYVLPLIGGAVGGIVVWLKLSKKNRK